MKKIATKFNYDFYIGWNKQFKPYYNIVPEGQPEPKGGYMSAAYICWIKKVPNLFEPTTIEKTSN